MQLQADLALACLTALIVIQQIYCDEFANTSSTSQWKCTCFSSYQGEQSHVLGANCSGLCDCNPAGSSGNSWKCSCSADRLPRIVTDNRNTGCFRACNCTIGSLTEVQPSTKHVLSKDVIVLMLCIVLTTSAFVSFLMCYVLRKDKCLTQRPVFSSDNDTSVNSSTDLICHKASSTPETIVNISIPVNPIRGCFYKPAFLFGTKRTIYGTIIQFSYSELEHGTNKFSDSNLIGVGGSSYVYRGQLRNGKYVAVKRLKTEGKCDADSVFSTEVGLLSRLHHCHVVPLLGYCSEFQGKRRERLLVFEYMPNGNLRDCLDRDFGEIMTWDSRVRIALGAARGLEYLHEAAAPRILHRDIKSTNILLDENWRAKITDLGMAKHLRVDGIASCNGSPARMQGTFGYFAPEYAIVGRASLKSDVFSFGVVLLELISGRQPIHKSTTKGEESLVLWATPWLQDSRQLISELPDPRMRGNFPEEEMQIMAYLAKECLLLDPEARPTMTEVVQILSTIAPDKSRRNIPTNIFLNSSACGTRGELHIKRPYNQVENPVAEEVMQATPVWLPARCSLHLEIECALCAEDNRKDADTVSTESLERLIVVSSEAKNLTPEDETVDLTEPWFESFCVANTRSP